jgi:hypothetical protein
MSTAQALLCLVLLGSAFCDSSDSSDSSALAEQAHLI